MASKLKVRHKIIQSLRNFLDKKDFIDIEPPILTKATPEGARDYLVPSRTQKGDFFALLGPNGAGKSTTIGVIATLVKRTSGHVQVFGKNVDTHVYETKLDLGVVPQEVNFNQFEKNVSQISDLEFCTQ